MRLLTLAALLAIPACADESISGYADPAATYRLTQIDGQPFTANATIAFPEQGTATGQTPCNIWSADQTAPYPWLALGPIAVTERACPDMADERVFLDALTTMTLAEVQGPILILSNDEGAEMVFDARR